MPMPAVKENQRTLPLLLSFTAGYVDTSGFLALQGLFTAHVTGNFVTLGASLALGTSGAVAKLLALPVFCAVVIAVRLLSSLLSRQVRAVFEVMLGLKMILLIVGAALAVRFGPFHDGDSWQVISDPNAHDAVLQALQTAGISNESAAIAMVPKNLMKLEGKNANAMIRLSEALEENDDVQNVYSNFDIDEKKMEALAS